MGERFPASASAGSSRSKKLLQTGLLLPPTRSSKSSFYTASREASQDVLPELLASASFLSFVPTTQPLSAGRAQAPRRPPPPESFPRRSSPWPPPPRRHRLELPHGCATPSSLPRRSVPPGAPPMAAPPGAPSLDGRHRPELPPWLRPSDPALTARHGRCSGPGATSPGRIRQGRAPQGARPGLGWGGGELPRRRGRSSLTIALDKLPQID